MKIFYVAFFSACVVACGDNAKLGSVSGGDTEVVPLIRTSSSDCPIPVSLSIDKPENAYVVDIKSNLSVVEEYTRITEKYDDIEAFTLSISCNCFSISSSEATMEALRCDEAVEGLSTNTNI